MAEIALARMVGKEQRGIGVSMVYYLSAGACTVHYLSTRHENATSFGLCAAFSRLNGSYYFNKYS